MKLRRVGVENVRSFLDKQELHLPSDIAILIGPNGGGKTNLLDTAVLALRLFLMKSWLPRHSPVEDWPDRYEWVVNDSLSARSLEAHSAGVGLTQRIELDLEVSASDIANMERSKAEAEELVERSRSRYTSFPGGVAASWNMGDLAAGQVLTYQIVNGGLQPAERPAQEAFRSYLETYETHSRLRAEHDRTPLATPMMSLPVNRSSGSVSSSVSLAQFNEYDNKRTVDAASSRAGGSVSALAVGRLAMRLRELLEFDNGKARDTFRSDPALQLFSKTLENLGYSWDLHCSNPYLNQYDVILTKQGTSFRVGAASAGERELLTYLFAIYALNVRDALIVIDEPELHLHPRWQKTLMTLFEQLASETGNQFVMATHSPVFVSPATIQYVSRVYSDAQRSRIVRLADSGLPEPKHLFGIVNSQNNERLFFADLVILVEGISDRIFFERVFRHLKLGAGSGKVYEVVSVGGKSLFPQYELLLTACKVPFVVIADLDYVKDIGDASVKALFAVSASSLKSQIEAPASRDAQSLLQTLDDMAAGGGAERLTELLTYLKSRHTRARKDLSQAETAQLESFIASQHQKGTFILPRGSLESLLPVGFAGKDLEKLIRLLSGDDFWDLLPPTAQAELETIVGAMRL